MGCGGSVLRWEKCIKSISPATRSASSGQGGDDSGAGLEGCGQLVSLVPQALLIPETSELIGFLQKR